MNYYNHIYINLTDKRLPKKIISNDEIVSIYKAEEVKHTGNPNLFLCFMPILSTITSSSCSGGPCMMYKLFVLERV